MQYLNLLGILVVIVGFALKLDSFLIIIVATAVTAIIANIDLVSLLQTCGSVFVANRSMLIFIVVMLATGTLERNGLKQAAANLISKIKGATPGALIGAYGVIRAIFGAFNVGIGGIAGFVRPVLIPMTEGAIESKGDEVNEEHLEQVKGMASGIENISWFFCQVLVVGGSGGLLVQSTLKGLGYDVALIDLVIVEIPIAVVAVGFACIYYFLKDKKLIKKYYNKGGK